MSFTGPPVHGLREPRQHTRSTSEALAGLLAEFGARVIAGWAQPAAGWSFNHDLFCPDSARNGNFHGIAVDSHSLGPICNGKCFERGDPIVPVQVDKQMTGTHTDPEPVQPATRSVQRTFTEFTFDAAHDSAPFGGMHGHTFRVEVAMTGSRHPKYGWSHNLLEVHKITDEVRGKLDHRLLNEIEGLPYASLENVAKWIWDYLKPRIDGLTEVTVRRGFTGQIEGCSYSERV